MEQRNIAAGHRLGYIHFWRIVTCGFITILQLLSTVIENGQAQDIVEDKSYIYMGCYTARTDLRQETVYTKMPQICVEMCEHQHLKYAILSGEKCFCSDNVIAEERQDEQLCNIRCLANKSAYCGGVGVHSYYTVVMATQSTKMTLHHLTVTNATENSLTVVWETNRPIKTQMTGTEEITNFLIKSHIVDTYSLLPLFRQPEFIVQNTETSFELTDLQPATQYNISVEVMCGQTVCGDGSIFGTTIVGEPSPVPKPPSIINRTESTITIDIPPVRSDNGPVTKLLIIVERVDNSLSQSFDSSLLGNWQKAQNDGLPYYIAAELDVENFERNHTQRFVVGDGKQYGSYTNPPLNNEDKEERHVHISLGVVSSLNGNTKTLYARSTHDQHDSTLDNFTYATFDSGRESIIALTVTCVVFAICLVLSLITYFYLRYKTCQTRDGRQHNVHEMTMQQPIIEQENNGFLVDNDLPATGNFKEQLDLLLDNLEATKRLPRNALRMNVNDILAEGRYGEVIAGTLMSASLPEGSAECQLHVLALDDLSPTDQSHLLREFRNITRLQNNENLLNFYGVSASADWFYFIFEHQTVTLKRRLIQSRRAPNSAPVQRITALSEQLILQWIYELASAMDYIGNCKMVHRQLCSHTVFITAESRLKLSVFGPIHFTNNNQQKIDITRWLAPEILRYQHYSNKSDIWAFACVAWECCALGGTPYANITNTQQLLDAMKTGSRPAQPAYVFPDLYQLLLNCWQLEPSERNTFEDITLSIRQLMTSPKHALNFDRLPELPGSSVLDTLPFYLPMLETQN